MDQKELLEFWYLDHQAQGDRHYQNNYAKNMGSFIFRQENLLRI